MESPAAYRRGMGQVFAFAFTAALNPTLLTATTVMLALLKPERLLLGYLIGASITSVSLGLVIVFAIPNSGSSSSSKHTVDPILNIVLGALLLLIVIVVASGRDKRRQAWSERRRQKARDKPPPRWRRTLSKGSARDTFVVGILLSFPGASYIAGMDLLSKQHISTLETVVVVLAFNVIMLILLELPLVGYVTKPEWTKAAVARFSSWLSRSGGRVGLVLGAGFSVLLIGRGIVNW